VPFSYQSLHLAEHGSDLTVRFFVTWNCRGTQTEDRPAKFLKGVNGQDSPYLQELTLNRPMQPVDYCLGIVDRQHLHRCLRIVDRFFSGPCGWNPMAPELLTEGLGPILS
jgi:hypothetical protein